MRLPGRANELSCGLSDQRNSCGIRVPLNSCEFRWSDYWSHLQLYNQTNTLGGGTLGETFYEKPAELFHKSSTELL